MRIDPNLLDDGMSIDAIAKELGLTKTNVHTILQRAMTKLHLKAIAKGININDYLEEDYEHHETTSK